MKKTEELDIMISACENRIRNTMQQIIAIARTIEEIGSDDEAMAAYRMSSSMCEYGLFQLNGMDRMKAIAKDIEEHLDKYDDRPKPEAPRDPDAPEDDVWW